MRRAFYVSYYARSDHGDCRAAHYARFQDWFRTRLAPQDPNAIYLR